MGEPSTTLATAAIVAAATPATIPVVAIVAAATPATFASIATIATGATTSAAGLEVPLHSPSRKYRRAQARPLFYT